MKNLFDFPKSAKEFSKMVNKQENQIYYMIDAKQLQLRWTDIEIRKFRIANEEKTEEKEQEKE